MAPIFITKKHKESVDEVAFESFFKQHYDKAFLLALRITRDSETSRDVTSDAFELTWSHMTTGEVDNPQAYLFTSVRNKSADYLRRKQVRDRYRQLILLTSTPSFSDNDLHERRLQRVMEAVEHLSPRTQEVVQAVCVERMKYKEAAIQFGISDNAVKKHVVKALKYLRAQLYGKEL